MTTSTRDHRRSRDLCPPTALFWKSVCTLSCLSVVCNACPSAAKRRDFSTILRSRRNSHAATRGNFVQKLDQLNSYNLHVTAWMPRKQMFVYFRSQQSAFSATAQLLVLIVSCATLKSWYCYLTGYFRLSTQSYKIQPMQHRYRRVVQFVWVGSVSLPVCLSGLLAADLPRWPGRGKSIADQLDPTSITDHTSSINPLTLTVAIWVQL